MESPCSATTCSARALAGHIDPFDERLANSLDASLPDPWADLDQDVWRDYVWHDSGLELDLNSVNWLTEGKVEATEIYQELILDSIDGLEASNLSRLVRIIRDWKDLAGEEEPLILLDHCEADAPSEPVESNRFMTLVEESHHTLLERGAGKDLWAWFADWREVFLSFADRFETLTGEEVVNLLRRALAVRRAGPRARAPRQRRARAERLVRLAASIAPNAPPLPLQPRALATGAG